MKKGFFFLFKSDLTQDGSSACEKVTPQVRIFLSLQFGFNVRYFPRFCLNRLHILALTKAWYDVADASLAVSLAKAVQDVLHTLEHLLG